MQSFRALASARVNETQDPISSVLYDFNAEMEDDDYEQLGNWENYTKLCYSRNPPVPALSLMKPVLNGEENAASFPHQHIGTNIDIILMMLGKVKGINDLNLEDNALDSSCTEPLIEFVKNNDQLSSLNLSNNPHIKAKAMKDLIDGIKESRSLEALNISNTGCTQSVGSAIAELITDCQMLVKLDVSCCSLRQACLDVAAALANASKLKRVNLADNELCIGGRKLAMQLGSGVTKGGTITRLCLSKNAINDEMAQSLLKGLAESQSLKYLDISFNNIGELSGRSISNLIAKTTSLKHLDISYNPVLNVTINKEIGQKAQEESDNKPGNKKDKKPKAYIPSVYAILTSLGKNSSIIDVKMVGLIVEPNEWQQKLDNLKISNQSVNVIYQAPQTKSYNFRSASALSNS